MRKSISEILERLEQTIPKVHSSLVEQSNPVLIAARDHKLTHQGLKEIIRQWCLSLADSVELLDLGYESLSEWSEISSILKQGVVEERSGSFNDPPFYESIKQVLSESLNLDATTATRSSNTLHFRRQMRSGLAEKSQAFIVGMLYGIQTYNCLELALLEALIASYLAKESPSSFDFGSLLNVDTRDLRHSYRNSLSLAIEHSFNLPQHEVELRAGFDFSLFERERWWKVNSLIYRDGRVGQLLRWCFGNQDGGRFYGSGRTYTR